MRKLTIDLQNRKIFLDDKVLKSTWSIEASDDMKLFGLDISQMIATSLIDAIEDEIGPLSKAESDYIRDELDKLSFGDNA